MRIEGYCTLWGAPSKTLEGTLYCEVIGKDAFRRSVQQAMSGRHCIYALADHDWKRRLGSTRRGNLRLACDERGVRFELDGVRKPAGLRGVSFDMVVTRFRRDGDLLYRVLEGALIELSLCTTDVCYPQLLATVKEVNSSLTVWSRF